MAYFNAVGEGVVDLALVRRILRRSNHDVINEYDRGGKSNIDKNLGGYANASKQCHWLVLRDLNSDAACAPTLLDSILPNRIDFPQLLLRIAVRESEAWILGDRAGFARFLGIAAANIPVNPEALPKPKEALVSAAATSRHRLIREGIVPRAGSGRSVGPEYNAILVDFINRHWSAETAIGNCDSLRRLTQRLAEIT